MTFRNLSCAVPMLCFALVVASGGAASAQTVQMAVYTDAYVAVDEGTVVYVDIYDASDIGGWGGQVYHYDYQSAVSVSGSLGSDSSSGGIMSHILGAFSDSEDDLDGYIDIDVVFVCSAAGPLGWSSSPPLTFPIRPYRYHYLWDTGYDGYLIPYWLSGANNHCRATAVEVPAWGSNAPSTMTMVGRSYVLPGIFGPSVEFCSNKCQEGHIGERVLSGSNAPGPINCPTR